MVDAVPRRGHTTEEQAHSGAAKGAHPAVAPSTAELVISLQRTAGNRAVARRIARQPARAAVPARLQRATYAEQTTQRNQALAKEIDRLSALSDTELADLEDEAWTKAALANHPKHAQYEREVEALEF